MCFDLFPPQEARITKIIRVNNERKVFSNPYFNNQWKLRATQLLKYRNSRKIIDVINYKLLSYRLKFSCDFRFLFYLYRYKNMNVKAAQTEII